MASKSIRRKSILQRAVVETLDKRVLLSGTPHDYVWKEAENYDATEAASDGHYWASYSQGGFSGSGVQAKERDKVKYEFGDAANSARLDYTANFAQAGKYYVWVRGIGIDGNSDSVHIGINGQPALSAGNIAVRREGVLWSTFSTENGAAGYVMIPVAGQHTINLYMREAGTSVDQIMLMTSKAFRPANAPAVPAVTLASTTANSGTIAEGETDRVTYTFTRSSGAGENALQVTGKVTDGNADFDDYTVTGEGVAFDSEFGKFTIDFGLDDVQKSIIVTAHADVNVEGDEYVTMALDETSGSSPAYHLGGSTSVTTTISDDPPVVTVTLLEDGSEDPDTEGTIDTPKPIRFTLSRSGGDLSLPVTVSYTVSGSGTHAADASDFSGVPSVELFTSEIIELAVIDDDEVEFREALVLALDDEGTDFLAGEEDEAIAEIADNDFTFSAFAVAFGSQGIKRDSDGVVYGVNQWDDWDGDGDSDVHGENASTPTFGYPISYQRSVPGTTRRISASASVQVAYKDPNVLVAKFGIFGFGEGPGAGLFDDFTPVIGTPVVQPDGSQVVSVTAEMTAQATANSDPLLNLPGSLPETIASGDLSIDWFLTRVMDMEDAPPGIVQAVATSVNRIYVTGAAAADAFETVLDLGCVGAGGYRPGQAGDTATEALDKNKDVVQGIWAKFSGRAVKRVDGTPMTYWSSAEFDHIAPMPAIRGYEQLLKVGDARCGEWAELFTVVLGAQGIGSHVQGVAVKQDNAVIGLPAQALDTPPTPPAGGRTIKVMIGMDVNTPAQNTPNPTSYFGDHALVKIDGIQGFYDPSYGEKFLGANALQDWEDAAISGFQYLYAILDANNDLVRFDYGAAWVAKQIGQSQTALLP